MSSVGAGLAASVPVLDGAIPAARGDPRGLGGVPDRGDEHLVMALDLSEDLGRLPVPKPKSAVSVARHDVVTTRRHARLARVPSDDVAFETLLPVELESVLRRVHRDLVVEILTKQPLVVGRLCHRRHRVESGVGDVLDGHRDAILPDEHLLIVGSGDESLGLLAERDGVDGGEVLVIHLLHLAGVGVILHDVLVRAPRQEHVLLRRVGVHLDTEWDLLVGEGRDTLAGLGVPQFAEAVIRARDETATVVGERDVPYRCGVAHVGTHALARVEHVPYLDLGVHAS
mmetsp:Transcript_15944/g.32242  ORF Transcript_15944/g.32242 Transcript_15944/m.32242 type:complete len:285 (+) Transcript_15944:193-1047(+)